MSKEQTPIEELRLEIIKHLPNNPNAVFDIISKANKVAKAKVLEALEREFSQVAIFDKNGKSKTGIDYFKTEVKPNYDI